MSKSSPKQSNAFKLIDNLINFAIYHEADSIHLEKSSSSNAIAVHYFGAKELNSTWTIPTSTGSLIWDKLCTLANIDEQQNSGYFLLTSACGPLHCQVESLGARDFTRLIIKAKQHQHNASWSSAQFDSKVADQVLNIINGKGLAILSGANQAFVTQLIYILLSSLSHDRACLASLEAPIMASLPEVNQCQWQAGQGTSYNNLFKHILDQDPDIIYASHLEKIDPQQLSQAASNKLILTISNQGSILNIIKQLLSQPDSQQVLSKLKFILNVHLVKQNCPHCLENYHLSTKDAEHLTDITKFSLADIKATDFAYSRGCLNCNFQASTSNIPLYDAFFPDSELIKTLIKQGFNKKTPALIASTLDLNALEDAWLKAQLKLISPLEIINQFGNN